MAATGFGFGGSPGPSMFEYQPPAVLNQAAPVNGTWYDILPATDYVRVYLIVVNVEDANETLEVQAIVDGETIAADDKACTHSTDYVATLYPSAVTRVDQFALSALAESVTRRAFLLEGHSVQIQVRKTTATGAGNLTGIVTYGVFRHAF